RAERESAVPPFSLGTHGGGVKIKTLALAALALGATRLGAQQVGAQQRVDPAIAARAEALLRRMTLEEKVGQMTQLTIQAVSRTRGTATTEQQLDSAKLEDALVRHHVGSLLNVWDAALTP